MATLADVDRFVYNGRMTNRNLPGSAAVPARTRIILKAHELFYRDGIRATGIDRIIAEAGVTKVTFYRHFPGKNDLIKAYLEYRHELWISWFTEALHRHQSSRSQPVDNLLATLKEWLQRDDFRGCAFINTVVEFDATLPEFLEIAQRHKLELADTIADTLPASKHRRTDAQAMAMAIDGAIVRAQMDKSPAHALKLLERLLRPFSNHPTYAKPARPIVKGAR